MPVSELRIRVERLEHRRRRARIFILFLVVAVVPAILVYSDSISIPHSFSYGSVISAAEVNANSDVLVTESNAQHSRLSALEGAAGVSVYKPIPYGTGVAGRTGNITTQGGTLLVFASASGYSATINNVIQIDVELDGVPIGSLQVFANTANTHMAVAADAIVVTGLAAGTYAITLQLASGTANTDDYSHVTVLELPI